MPFRTVEIRSPLSAAAVEERIGAIVQPRLRGFRALTGSAATAPLHGEVAGRTFNVSRVIRYRNSFLPVIRGVIAENIEGGTTIRLRMTLHPATAVFMLLWMGFVAVSLVPLAVKGAGLEALIPAAMLLFAVGLVSFGFYPEARKAERIIREAVSATR